MLNAAAEASPKAVRTAYRHLLRGINAAAHFSRPAASNLQRLYRTQYEQVHSQQNDVNPEKTVHKTLLFLLSASHSPVLSAAAAATWKEAYLAHPTTFAKFDTFRSQRSLRLEARAALKKQRVNAAKDGKSSAPGRRTEDELALAGILSPPDDLPQRSAGSHRTLAHKVTRNLASLTYHHLSPHTRMMGLHKRAGGTDASTVPRLTRSRLRASGIFSEDEVEEMGAAGSSSGRTANREHLPSLLIPAKPITGPKLPTGTSQMRWDGQKPVQSFSPAAAAIGTHEGSENAAPTTDEIQRLQTRVEELAGRYMQLKNAAEAKGKSDVPSSPKSQHKGKSSKHKPADPLAAAKEALTQIKGRLKAATKAAQKQREERLIELLPIQALHSLVKDAEKSSGGVWLGATRFGMRARGEWLPP